MSLSKKFILALISSVLFITIVNIWAFYVLYTNYLKLYLSEKIDSKSQVTLEYINNLIEKQTNDDLNNIFSSSEIEFFDLIENNDWKIKLDKQENVDIVVSYLVKSWISPKYIEEIIPTNNLRKVLKNLKDKTSPEYNFLNRLIISMILINLLTIAILAIFIWFFVRKTIFPIRQVTNKIWTLTLWKSDFEIDYNKEDEIWLLIKSINELNKKLKLQKNIRSRLLADISHELKTPITSIQCYLEGIHDWVIKLDNKNLKSITDEMTRLISLVNRIMNYEKFENEALEINTEKQNISNIVKEITETHKKNLKQSNQRIKIVWDEFLEKICDKNLFRQLVHNMIWNFIKYAWKDTLLTINITKNYIDFKDNWKWVKQSEIWFLTEKFYQSNVEKTWDIEKRWIWVWLSLVEKIIEAHKWRYEIKTDINKWFSFKIFF